MSDIVQQLLKSQSQDTPVEMHELADVRILLTEQLTLIVNVDTASRFVGEPKISLQLENGTRIESAEINAVGEGGYKTEFHLGQFPAYLDILVDVRGKSGSGAISSAVAGFTITRFEEPGRYEVFGPGGATRLKLTAKKGRPLLIWLGSVNQDILQRSGGLVPVTAAFEVGGFKCRKITSAAHLSAMVGPTEANAGMQLKDADIALYQWKEKKGKWVRLTSSGFNSQQLTVGADIKRFGIFAAFTPVRSSAVDDLREENVALRRVIVDLERQLEMDRNSAGENNVLQMLEHTTGRSLISTALFGGTDRDDEIDGW